MDREEQNKIELTVVAEAAQKIRDALKEKGYVQDEATGLWGNGACTIDKNFGVRQWLHREIKEQLSAWNEEFQDRKKSELASWYVQSHEMEEGILSKLDGRATFSLPRKPDALVEGHLAYSILEELKILESPNLERAIEGRPHSAHDFLMGEFIISPKKPAKSTKPAPATPSP